MSAETPATSQASSTMSPAGDLSAELANLTGWSDDTGPRYTGSMSDCVHCIW